MHKILALCLCLILLAACQPKPADDSVKVLLEQADLQLTISPASIPVETPLRLTLVSQYPVTVISAELTGISMYMGLIPLRFQKLNTTTTNVSEQWQSEFLLGACSDPAMLWQLNLTVQLADGKELSLNKQFNSSW